MSSHQPQQIVTMNNLNDEIFLGQCLDQTKPVDTGCCSAYLSPSGFGVVPIVGPIAQYRSWYANTSINQIVQQIKHFEDLNVPIILDINSGGGSANSLFELTKIIRDLEVPIQTYVGNLCASAAYAIAAATDSISVHPTASIGSVGACITVSTVSDRELQIKTYVSAVSPNKILKGRDLDAAMQKRVDEVGQYFIDDLSVSLNLSSDQILNSFGQGDVLNASEALSNNMITRIVESFDEILLSTPQTTARDFNMQTNETATNAALQLKLDEALAKVTALEKDESKNLAELEASHKASLEKAKAEAKVEETARITGIKALCLVGSEELIEAMIKDGTTVEMAALRLIQAEKKQQESAKANLESTQTETVLTTSSDTQDLKDFGGDPELLAAYDRAKATMNFGE